VQRIVEETMMVLLQFPMLTIESWIHQKMGCQISSIDIVNGISQGDQVGVYRVPEQTLVRVASVPYSV
jgi:hypothetical protein